jgi:hypothetical protein
VNRNSRASSQQTKEKPTELKVVPPIITNPAELDNLSSSADKTPTTSTNNNNHNNNNNTNHNAISTESDESSTSPISLPPQTSPVVSVIT